MATAVPIGKARKRRRRLVHRPPAISPGQVKNEINVTPLVDVVLVLLIIFMVVTPMLTRGVKVELPQTSFHDKRPDSDQIIVSVTADAKVFLDAKQAEGDALVVAVRKALGQRRKDGGQREVHVKADKRLKYADVRKVLERVHEAGAAQVGLGSDAKKETK